MALFTSEYLKGLARNSFINENTVLFSSQKRNSSHRFDIFLSHSYLDLDEVKGIYLELTNLGYSVYVDWIVDSHLDRAKVTKETAELIRLRLKSSKSLLLAISTNANLSKWMPWELGYVDGNTNRCALIPVSKENKTISDFPRTEYLSLYPFVDVTNIGTTQLWVNDDVNTYVDLKDWIRGEKPIKRN